MPRTFHHDLDAGLPGALHELAQRQKFLYLAPVRGIGQAAGTHAVTQAQSDVIFQRDIEKPIVLLVQRVLAPILQNPTQQEGASPGNDIRESALLPQMLDCPPGHTAMNCHEVHAVLRLFLDDAEDVIGVMLTMAPRPSTARMAAW